MQYATWIFCLAFFFLVSGFCSELAEAQTWDNEKPQLLAQKKKRKKRRRKKKPQPAAEQSQEAGEEGGEAMAPAGGPNMHAAQGEIGPYKGEIGLSGFRFQSESITTTPDEGDAVTSSGTNILLSVEYLFLFGSFGVGPILDYSSFSNTSEQAELDGDGVPTGETTDVTSTNSSTGFGVAAKYYLFDLNTEAFVPYAHFSFTIDSTTATVGEADPVSTSGNTISLGAGANYFLAPYVALNGRLSYDIASETNSEAKLTVGTNTLDIFVGITAYR